MQEIIDKYPCKDTPYLLPIISSTDKDERRQYRSANAFVTRKLKEIQRMLRLDTPLTMYVTRHSWASIAKSKNVPVAVISESMGHDSEATTQIYLASLSSDVIDRANLSILTDVYGDIK
jgi:integrase